MLDKKILKFEFDTGVYIDGISIVYLAVLGKVYTTDIPKYKQEHSFNYSFAYFIELHAHYQSYGNIYAYRAIFSRLILLYQAT